MFDETDEHHQLLLFSYNVPLARVGGGKGRCSVQYLQCVPYAGANILPEQPSSYPTTPAQGSLEYYVVYHHLYPTRTSFLRKDPLHVMKMYMQVTHVHTYLSTCMQHT